MRYLFILALLFLAACGRQSSTPTYVPTCPGVTAQIYNLNDGTKGPFWATTNPWNANGVSFTETITAYPCTFPIGTLLSWSFPSNANGNNVYAYPEIVYGSNWGTRPPNTIPPKTINSFTNLSVTYNLSVNAGVDDYDCLIETWPSTTPVPSPSSKVLEVGFLCHTPLYLWTWLLTQPSFFYSANGFHAMVSTVQGSGGVPLILVMPITAPNVPVPRDMTIGTQTMPIRDILMVLVAKGKVSPSAYITEFEFGFEVAKNSGSVVFNNLQWTWQ